jgi:hypothetical protein
VSVARIAAQVSGRVHAPQQNVYDFFLEVDVTRILTGRGILSAVVSVDDPIGRWDAPGQMRMLHLEDGSSLRERLTRVDAPMGFAYEIDRITGPLGRLVETFSGRWSFEPEQRVEAGSDVTTTAHWHYTFAPRTWLAWTPAFVIVRGLWQPYMARVLARATELAEQEHPSPS